VQIDNLRYSGGIIQHTQKSGKFPHVISYP
jgi:hypothetical protein